MSAAWVDQYTPCSECGDELGGHMFEDGSSTPQSVREEPTENYCRGDQASAWLQGRRGTTFVPVVEVCTICDSPLDDLGTVTGCDSAPHHAGDGCRDCDDDMRYTMAEHYGRES